MNKSDSFYEPDDREIEIMLKYVPAYSADNAKNIKNKFAQKARMRKRRLSLKKLALIGAAASMIFVTTFVYAGVLDLSKIYWLVFGENFGYVEHHIEPLVDTNDSMLVQNEKYESEKLVEKESSLSIQSEYDGIVIKLISAINDENALRIFLTATDTKSDRLCKSLDFSSWGLSQGYGGNISVIDYNNETKTATLMITSLGSDHKGNATLSVNGFSTGRELFKDLPESNIDISGLVKGHSPKIVSQDDIWSFGGVANNRELYEKSRLLKSDEIDIPFDSTEIFTLSNIGFVDGLLHIQAKVFLHRQTFTEGYYINAKLINTEKEIVYESSTRVDFMTDIKYAYQEHAKEPHYEYSEMIYEGITTPEQLNDLSLTIDYMKSPIVTEGKWEFSFIVPEKVTTEFHIDKEIPINGKKIMINKISLSPLGITVHLPQNMSSDYSHNDSVYVEYADGTRIELNQSAIHTYENESTLIFEGEIIEIEKAQKLIINGEQIDISQ